MNPADEVPEGAAVFPLIPAELGVNPLLLAVIHAAVFLDGSSDEVIDPAAADEAVGFLATYLGRLDADQMKRVREDFDCLISFARQEQWSADMVQFLKTFLDDVGAGKGEAT